MEILPVFEFGETVYFKAGMDEDTYKIKGHVISYEVHPGGTILYEIRWADMSRTVNHAFELTDTPFIPNTDLN